MRICAVVWDDAQRRPVAWFAETPEAIAEGGAWAALEPFRGYSGGRGFLSPGLAGLTDDCFEDLDLSRDGVELIQRQRAVPFHDVRGRPFCGVGGCAQLTTVDSDGVRQEIVAEWPEDRVGERIAL